MQIVPRVSTPISEADAARAIVAAWPFPQRPLARQEAELYLGHVWAIEDGRGAAMKNNNPGNLSASDSYNGEAFRPSWFELTETSSDKDKARHALMLDNKAPSAFRSYRTPADGFNDYILQVLKTFPKIAAAANMGDPQKFADAVFDSRYAVEGPDGDRVSLGKSLRSLVSEFERAKVFAGLKDAPLAGGAVSSGPSPSPLAVVPSSGPPSAPRAPAGAGEYELRLGTDVASSIQPGGELLCYARIPRAGKVLRLVIDHEQVTADAFAPYDLPAGAIFATMVQPSRMLPAQQIANAVTLIVKGAS